MLKERATKRTVVTIILDFDLCMQSVSASFIILVLANLYRQVASESADIIVNISFVS